MSLRKFVKIQYPWAANKQKLDAAQDQLIAELSDESQFTEAAIKARYVELKGEVVEEAPAEPEKPAKKAKKE